MVLDQPWPLNKALIAQDIVSKGSLTPPPPLLRPLCATAPSLSQAMVVCDHTTKVLELLTLLERHKLMYTCHEHLSLAVCHVLNAF